MSGPTAISMHAPRVVAWQLLSDLLAMPYFHAQGSDPAAIPFHLTRGSIPLVLMVGDNASGKSFARRLVMQLCQEHPIECINLSMEGRRRAAYNIGLSLVYGNEGTKSTGQNSVQTVLGAIRTAHDRTTDHVIFWDEPDLGLSDEWAAGVGHTICDFACKLPHVTRTVFVVTHSKPLVAELREATPHFVYFGDEKDPPRSLDAWLARPTPFPRHPQALVDLSNDRYRRIQQVQRQVGKAKP